MRRAASKSKADLGRIEALRPSTTSPTTEVTL
jgi:hypothetical protein